MYQEWNRVLASTYQPQVKLSSLWLLCCTLGVTRGFKPGRPTYEAYALPNELSQLSPGWGGGRCLTMLVWVTRANLIEAFPTVLLESQVHTLRR